MAILIGNIPYTYKAPRTYYVKEKPGDGSLIIAKLPFNSEYTCSNWLSDWGTFQKRAEEQGSRAAPTIGGSPDTRRTA